MHKKIELEDLDIPKDDLECWDKYPKYRWVYDLSRLLDAQNIKWSLFRSDELQDQTVNIHLESVKPISYLPSWIYINKPTDKTILSEVYIVKGEIRYIRYIDKISKELITESVGNIELRINAFVSIHFQKFTGVISLETVGSDIYSIRLKPLSELALKANTDIAKLIKRIYKKNDISQLIGLSDHTLHVSIAS